MREYGSEFPLPFEGDGYMIVKLPRKVTDCELLQSGRQGLRMIADELNGSAREILMPAYCCDSMVKPFEDSGWKVFFYPIDSDFNVDIDAVKNLVSKMPSDSSMLLMNYFGISAVQKAISDIRAFAPKLHLIYDFTQLLLDFDDVYNPEVEYYAGSIRKWMGVNSAAIVLSRNQLMMRGRINMGRNEFVDKRTNAQNDKFMYETSRDAWLKNHFRSALRDCEVYLDNHTEYYEIDSRSIDVIKTTNFSMMRNARRNNLGHLFNLIKNNPKIGFVKDWEKKMLSGMPCAFMLPILVDNRDAYQSALAQNGVYTQLLWPILPQAKPVCAVARDMETRMLAIPIDQRFDYEDIEDMGKIINAVIR